MSSPYLWMLLRMLDQLVADRLLSVSGSGAKLRHAVDDVAHEVSYLPFRFD